MDHEPGHPNVTLDHWEAFRKGFSPLSFAEVVNRSELDLPDWFVPLARGVAIPSDYVLRQVGCRPGSHRPAFWKRPSKHLFHFDQGQWGLTVEKIGQYWFAKRWERGTPRFPIEKPDEVLVFPFGSTPIVARTYQPVIRVVQRCRWDEPQPFGYKWVIIRPMDCEGDMRFANERRVREMARPHTDVAGQQ